MRHDSKKLERDAYVVARYSPEEARLFISGILAHEVLQFELTPRVAQLREELGGNPAFKKLVCEALRQYSHDGIISEDTEEFLRRKLPDCADSHRFASADVIQPGDPSTGLPRVP